MENLNELIKSANNGNQEAIEKLIYYFSEQGDEENVDYYQKLKEQSNKESNESLVNKNGSNNIDFYQFINELKNDIDDNLDESISNNEEKYASYSIKELKDLENGDVYACFELGKRYAKQEIYDQAIKYYKKTIERFEITDNLSPLGEIIKCHSFINLAVSLICLGKEKNVELNKEATVYLQNAIETNCAEKYKKNAYDMLGHIYEYGLPGVEENAEKADELNLKVNSNSKEGCLKLAVDSYNDSNLIDYEYWLEKSVDFKQTDEEYYLQQFIEMKLAIFRNDAKKTNILNGTYALNSKYAKYLNSKEIDAISTTLTNECNKSNLQKSTDNDILFCCCFEFCLALNKENSDISNFIKKYLIVSKNNNNFTLLKISNYHAYINFFNYLVEHGDTGALSWLEEVSNGNVLDLSNALKVANDNYQNLMDKKQIKDKTREEFKNIEEKIKQRENPSLIFDKEKEYKKFSFIMLAVFITLVLLKLPGIFRFIVLIVWLVRTFKGKDGYVPDFAKQFSRCLLDKQYFKNGNYIPVDFEIEVHDPDCAYSNVADQNISIYFGKYDEFGYLTDETYQLTNENGEYNTYSYLYAKIKGYDTIFRCVFGENRLYINIPSNEALYEEMSIQAGYNDNQKNKLLKIKNAIVRR